MKNSKWYVYILECGDGSLYTGSTNDLEKRVEAHQTGQGAKYTRSHLPVTLAFFEEAENRSEAGKREAEIKKLDRDQKLELIREFNRNHNHPNRHKNIPATYLILKRENKILLLRRFKTGYNDGLYSLVAGHVDEGETFTQALLREAREEAGLEIPHEKIKTIHVMHRRSATDGSQRVDVFHLVEDFDGEPKNMEPQKCDDLSWFEIDDLPENIIPYIRKVIEYVRDGVFYSEHGWD